ncbi:HAMP domain-containing sensor histidine kinase [Glaciihabitans sp. UYNi722]|uniref:sensor histidine kinase n=1 Tax=Glaciihabitans sp. UYNi722 TaxID=3156344 RepID=UPI003399AFD1
MKRGILRVAVLSASVALALFLVPLGFAVMSLSLADARSNLEDQALHAALTIDPLFSKSDKTEIPQPTAGQQLALYGVNGSLVVGTGPKSGDAAVSAALAGRTAPETVGGSLVVVVPIASAESVSGVVRTALPLSAVWTRIVGFWVLLILGASVALAIGAGAARSLARRIVSPMQDLARASQALGDGDFGARTTLSGLAEIDAAGAALNATAVRLSAAMARERKLTSNASHQLRTPLTGLRALLEGALHDTHADLRQTLRQGIERADALEITIDEIIRLGRGAAGGSSCDAAAQVEEAQRRWNGGFASRGRPLRVAIKLENARVAASEPAVRQVIDVLLDNALRHGSGDVLIRLRDAHGAVAIDVRDDGSSIDARTDPFVDGFSSDGGTGLGLPLAKLLVADAGGELLLTARTAKTQFTIILLAAATSLPSN